MDYKEYVRRSLLQDAYFTVNKHLIKELGLNEAIVLTALIDYHKFLESRDRKDYDWFPLKKEALQETINIGRHSLNMAIQDLVQKGLIKESKLQGIPPTKSYFIDYERTDNVLRSPSSICENQQINLQKSANQFVETDKSNCRNPQNNNKEHIVKNITPPLYSPLTGGISPQGEIFPQSEIEEVEVEEVKKPKAKKKAKAAAIEFDFATVQDDFKEIVSVWLEYKRKKQQSYKSQMSFAAMYQKLYKFSGGNAEVAKQIIEEAIGNNWAGFFPLKGNSAAQPKKSLEDSMRETERIYQERKRMKEEYGW